ncbi:hypothetical protein [Embleya sp. NPDC050493]|uniref:hypothetical protein n=1 Tax=Embleya sp. NPDC050493 TaxID=3363989 RepID=UPI0037B607AD
MGTAKYAEFVFGLSQLVEDAASDRWSRIEDDVHHALNGQAASEARRLVPRETRRAIGCFFTAGLIRREFDTLMRSEHDGQELFWDPTCGAGDLLLSAAGGLPLAESPALTVHRWASRLRGTDLHQPFIDAARLRLLLLVLYRHRERGQLGGLSAAQVARAFPGLTQGDGLTELRMAAGARPGRAVHLLLNPPYGPAAAPAACSWSTGRTSSAALFTAAAVDVLGRRGRMTAVLPDVLRSGSRYRAWRAYIDERVSVEGIRSNGQFDDYTDIDVFTMTAVRRTGAVVSRDAGWQTGAAGDEGTATVGDSFTVSVGPVVDNRDVREGPLVPYLTARQLPPSDSMGMPERTRRFNGKLLTPPFVVVRRTSRPGQGVGGRPRGAGVLVLGDQPLAVDNHLITLVPTKRVGRGVRQCRDLLRTLGSPSTAKWLDERIRCRHLTVSAAKAIPWAG